jgi:protein TonB
MRGVLLIPIACLASAVHAQQPDPQSLDDAMRSAVANTHINSNYVTRATRAMPASNPGEWIVSDDYPTWAAQYGVTGRVGVRLKVDESGRVAECQVTLSSGVADLDTLACRKITERGRFVPATNERGRPVAGEWRSTVVWQVPERGQLAIPRPGILVSSLVVERDGSVSECRIEEAEGEARRTSGQFCASAVKFSPPTDARGNPQRTRLRVTMSVSSEPLSD